MMITPAEFLITANKVLVVPAPTVDREPTGSALVPLLALITILAATALIAALHRRDHDGPAAAPIVTTCRFVPETTRSTPEGTSHETASPTVLIAHRP